MAELLVVRSKIKDVAKGVNVSGDFAEALSKEVERLIKKACERAKANKRGTTMASIVYLNPNKEAITLPNGALIIIAANLKLVNLPNIFLDVFSFLTLFKLS